MPRKTPAPVRRRGPGQGASMRPRPDAAENAARRRAICRGDSGFNEAAARCRGKPAPRPRPRGVSAAGFNEAAARCRGKLAGSGCPGAARRGFNEAAARCRGKQPEHAAPGGAGDRASMRPRPDAAENACGGTGLPTDPACFNEAAARCRGKRPGWRTSGWASACFNEAAARCRGKHARRPRAPPLPPAASMRPRPDAAENPPPPTRERARK